MHAQIQLTQTGFLAVLESGNHIERTDLQELAVELHKAGVSAETAFVGDWRDGPTALLAGQAIALKVELRKLSALSILPDEK